jgi:hypothetical protein
MGRIGRSPNVDEEQEKLKHSEKGSLKVEEEFERTEQMRCSPKFAEGHIK